MFLVRSWLLNKRMYRKVLEKLPHGTHDAIIPIMREKIIIYRYIFPMVDQFSCTYFHRFKSRIQKYWRLWLGSHSADSCCHHWSFVPQVYSVRHVLLDAQTKYLCVVYILLEIIMTRDAEHTSVKSLILWIVKRGQVLHDIK